LTEVVTLFFSSFYSVRSWKKFGNVTVVINLEICVAGFQIHLADLKSRMADLRSHLADLKKGGMADLRIHAADLKQQSRSSQNQQ
jgi:hypothetical protein